eukprot:TRINITY_DN105901_c0_g1_i1.p1 TRINITY_DN105901_c0_g1~~TRINITY_DN105901_c0_g1_i1.p1  ORF type:complete len:458 (-),score=11.88 TRINITY_DN105901_c0_g1_i1:45-1418(-)
METTNSPLTEPCADCCSFLFRVRESLLSPNLTTLTSIKLALNHFAITHKIPQAIVSGTAKFLISDVTSSSFTDKSKAIYALLALVSTKLRDIYCSVLSFTWPVTLVVPHTAHLIAIFSKLNFEHIFADILRETDTAVLTCWYTVLMQTLNPHPEQFDTTPEMFGPAKLRPVINVNTTAMIEEVRKQLSDILKAAHEDIVMPYRYFYAPIDLDMAETEVYTKDITQETIVNYLIGIVTIRKYVAYINNYMNFSTLLDNTVAINYALLSQPSEIRRAIITLGDWHEMAHLLRGEKACKGGTLVSTPDKFRKEAGAFFMKRSLLIGRKECIFVIEHMDLELAQHVNNVCEWATADIRKSIRLWLDQHYVKSQNKKCGNCKCMMASSGRTPGIGVLCPKKGDLYSIEKYEEELLKNMRRKLEFSVEEEESAVGLLDISDIEVGEGNDNQVTLSSSYNYSPF